MSVKQMALVWEHQLPHPEQSIMLALADHADDHGRNIYPSIDYIAWKTGYGRSSVKNILSRLRATGVLRVVRNHTHARPTEYAIDWTAATPKGSFRGVKFTPLATEGASHGDGRVTAIGPQGASHGDGRVTAIGPEPSLNHQLTINEPSTPPYPPQIAPPGFYEHMSPNGDAHPAKSALEKIELPKSEPQKLVHDSEGTSPSLELACAEQVNGIKITAPRTRELSRRRAATGAERSERIDYEALLAAWNENCSSLPRALRLTDARRRALQRLVAEHGGEGVMLLTDATRQVASDEFWLERGYGLDNLLRPGRVVEKAEKYRATSNLSAGERRMATTAANIARAIGGWK